MLVFFCDCLFFLPKLFKNKNRLFFLQHIFLNFDCFFFEISPEKNRAAKKHACANSIIIELLNLLNDLVNQL